MKTDLEQEVNERMHKVDQIVYKAKIERLQHIINTSNSMPYCTYKQVYEALKQELENESE